MKKEMNNERDQVSLPLPEWALAGACPWSDKPEEGVIFTNPLDREKAAEMAEAFIEELKKFLI